MDQFKKLNATFDRLDESDLLETGGLSKKGAAGWNAIFGIINHFLGD